MPGVSTFARLSREGLRKITALGRVHRGTILLLLCGLSVGLIFALLANQVQPGDRVHIGNTAGTLSVIAEIDGQRVMIGAGSTRSHAADFSGRSTRPWDREIDLLIVPGWDDLHATGALGLLERGDIRGMAVVGLPGEAPVWTLLEREAQRQDVPVRFLEDAHRLQLGKDALLTISEIDSDNRAGAWVRLEYHGVLFDLVDAQRGTTASPPANALSASNEHVLINMRSGPKPDVTSPTLLVRPEPFHSSEFDEESADFIANIARNDRLVVRLSEDELRVPLDQLAYEG